jgi:hypothetical protein
VANSFAYLNSKFRIVSHSSSYTLRVSLEILYCKITLVLIKQDLQRVFVYFSCVLLIKFKV